MIRKHRLFAIVYYIILFLFTLYAVMDAFVIRRAYVIDATQVNFEKTEEIIEATPAKDDPVEVSEEIKEESDVKEPVVTETSYEDEHIKITLSDYYEWDTRIYIADVELDSIEYMKTAFAEDTYGRNIIDLTSNIAREHDAIFAVNGDYFGARERGYVIRNGVDYPRTTDIYDVLCICTDGSFKVYGPEDKTSEELVNEGVWQAFSFGPTLVMDNEVVVAVDAEVGRAQPTNPRTAIGIIDKGHYIFLVSDGRTNESSGLSLYDMACFMKELGVQIAYNLDGGGSSSMYFDGRVINQPTSGGKTIAERGVSDIVYIGY